MTATKIVIIGGGHAAAQVCASLADAGPSVAVTLVSAEPRVPYQRPPLSKGFIKDRYSELSPIRPEATYLSQGVALCLGDAAVQVDRVRREVVLASGKVLPYDALVLATGAKAKTLPILADPCHGVLPLRGAQDAEAIREAIWNAESLAVLGGGFIGLELAATARQLGKDVHVIERAPRLLARSVSPEISDWLLRTHREAGIDVELSTPIDDLRFDEAGHLTGLVRFGEVLPLDLLLLGIGAAPDTSLAEAAGLTCRDGVEVDEFLRTSDPAIYAVGDCASFPYLGGAHRRLESVQNAVDQAKCVAAALIGQPAPYRAVPWFWSEQGNVRLQMVGVGPDDTVRVHRPGKTERDFALLHYDRGVLVAAEVVNAPVEFMTLRRILEKGGTVPMEAAADTQVPLKSFA